MAELRNPAVKPCVRYASAEMEEGDRLELDWVGGCREGWLTVVHDHESAEILQ